MGTIIKYDSRYGFLLALAITGLAGGAISPVLAQSCSFTVSNINFGNIDVTTGASFSSNGTMTANCSGASGRWLTICPNIGSGTGDPVGHDPRRLKKWGASTRLAFNLYWPGSSAIWGSFLWPFPPRPPVLHMYLAGGSGSLSRTIDASIHPGQNARRAGVYTSRFSGNHVLFQYKYGYSSDCTGATRARRPRFRVRARNVKSCIVSATDLDFGAVGDLSANVDTTGAVTVRCTRGVNYRIRLDGGNSGTTNPAQRRMSNGADQITYGIYRDAARTQGWGRFNSNSVSGTGNGYDQVYTTYGRVPPQPTPPVGVYVDTVVVTVRY